MFNWFRQWSLLKKIIVGVPSFIIAIIASMIATGAYPVLVSVGQFILANLWLLIIVFAVFLGFSVFFKELAILRAQRNNLKASLEGRNKLFRVVDSLLRLLPSLISAEDPNKEEEMHRLMRSLLANATKLVPQVYGASLFLPNESCQEMTIWEHQGVPGDSAARAKCYIGPADVNRKRGIAGEAFVKKELILTHLIGQDEDGQWQFDKPSYIDFTEEGTYPAFKSLVCIPIIAGTSSIDCLGVVCLDSANVAAFDSPDAQELLKLLARYFASAILIRQEIQSGQRIT